MLEVEAITRGGCGHGSVVVECGFLRREGAVKEHGQRGGIVLFPVSISAPLPPPLAYHLLSCRMLPLFSCDHSFSSTHIHVQHNLTDLAQELRPVWRKCLHPLMSPRACSVILSNIFWPGLSWGLGAAFPSFQSQTSPPTASFAHVQ